MKIRIFFTMVLCFGMLPLKVWGGEKSDEERGEPKAKKSLLSRFMCCGGKAKKDSREDKSMNLSIQDPSDTEPDTLGKGSQIRKDNKTEKEDTKKEEEKVTFESEEDEGWVCPDGKAQAGKKGETVPIKASPSAVGTQGEKKKKDSKEKS